MGKVERKKEGIYNRDSIKIRTYLLKRWNSYLVHFRLGTDWNISKVNFLEISNICVKIFNIISI